MKSQIIIVLLIGVAASLASGNKHKEDESLFGDPGAFSGIVAALQSCEYGLMKAKDLAETTTTFGIKKGKDWLIRVDGAHPGANYDHLNINPKLSGVKDPHMRLPAGSASVGSAATTILDAVGTGAYYYAVATDGLRVGEALLQDLKEHGVPDKHTAKAAAKVGASWGGGYLGGAAGGIVGSVAGTVVGVVCVPCGAAMVVAGTVLGGAKGGAAGVEVANAIFGD